MAGPCKKIGTFNDRLLDRQLEEIVYNVNRNTGGAFTAIVAEISSGTGSPTGKYYELILYSDKTIAWRETEYTGISVAERTGSGDLTGKNFTLVLYDDKTIAWKEI